QFSPLLMGGQQEGHTGFVSLLHALHGLVWIQRRQLDDGLNDKKHVVLVIVVQQHFPRRQETRRLLLRGRLLRLLRLQCRRTATPTRLLFLLLCHRYSHYTHAIGGTNRHFAAPPA